MHRSLIVERIEDGFWEVGFGIIGNAPDHEKREVSSSCYTSQCSALHVSGICLGPFPKLGLLI